MSKIYLGKSGKAYGPYTEKELESLQSQGLLSEFQWLWDENQKCWQALEPAPAPLITKVGIQKYAFNSQANPVVTKPTPVTPAPQPVQAAPQYQAPPVIEEQPVYSEPVSQPVTHSAPAPVIPIQSAQTQKSIEKPKKKFKEKNYQAVCHNQQTVVNGELTQFDENCGELISIETSGKPGLSVPSQVFLNILDAKSGKSTNLQAKVYQIQRIANGWSYRIEWDQKALKFA